MNVEVANEQLDKLRVELERYAAMLNESGRTSRYDRLELLAMIYTRLELLAQIDGFGTSAVTGWSTIISRENS